MVTAVYGALRILLQALVTSAFSTAVLKLLDGTLKALALELMDTENITETEAKDILFDILIEIMQTTGIIAGLLTLRVPVKISEYLGLTSKKFGPKALSPKQKNIKAKIQGTAGNSVMSKAFPNIFKFVAVGTGLFWLINQTAATIEPGIYQPEQTNAIYRKLGIPFQYPVIQGLEKLTNLETAELDQFLRLTQATGAVAINNTFAQQTQLLTKQNLSDLIIALYGREFLAGRKTDKETLKSLVAPFLVFPGGKPSPQVTTTTDRTGVQAQQTTPRVFTGVLTGGRLGEQLEFTTRKDDLIENISELQQAIMNNESPWLASLPGRIVREISVVSSVLVDGITKRAEARKIEVGTNKDGSPRLKTIVNKFAVADIFYIQDSNSRIKLDRIIYGPIDALSFQPTPQELNELASKVKRDIFTQSTDNISGVVSTTPTEDIRIEKAKAIETETGIKTRDLMGQIAPSNISIPDPVLTPSFIEIKRTGRPTERIKLREVRDLLAQGNSLFEAYLIIRSALEMGEQQFYEPSTLEWFNSLTPNDIDALRVINFSQAGKDMQSTGTAQPAQNSGMSQTSTTSPERATLPATTLSEYYANLGKPLPPLTERADLYQSLGLGQSAFYTGTMEQNVKLLNALLSQK